MIFGERDYVKDPNSSVRDIRNPAKGFLPCLKSRRDILVRNAQHSDDMRTSVIAQFGKRL